MLERTFTPAPAAAPVLTRVERVRAEILRTRAALDQARAELEAAAKKVARCANESALAISAFTLLVQPK
jgi:hypothetical protein